MSNETFYNDVDLLEQLKAGSEVAFTRIYQQYWQRVYAVAYYFSRQKEAAEEVVQQVFLSLWERRDSLQISHSLEGYLATAAKYNVLDARIREQRRRALLEKAPLPADPATSEQELQARILADYLHDSIAKLPEKTRVIFQYRRHEDLSITEIAQRLDISPKTVESHITKAIKALQLSLRHLQSWFF